jgi:hypothetical protein
MKVQMSVLALKPIEYINKISESRHMVLFYHDVKKARKIEFQFILNGLLKGQHSSYLTHDETEIVEKEMKRFGIDVEKFQEKNLLHIYKVRDPTKDPKGFMHGYELVVKQVLGNSRPPHRIVGRLIKDMSTKEAVKSELEIEHLFHSNFADFDGYVLCSYPYDTIEPSQRSEWITSLVNEHHASVFLPKDAEGISFSLP